MRKMVSFWCALATLLVGCWFVSYHANTVWSSSVDIAHHYSLVFRLGEHWSLAPSDPTLGEMNVYPRSSHIAAAFIGKLVGSPFMGMHLVALTALLLLWASCLAIMYAAPDRTGPYNAIALAVLVVLNFGAFRLHGAEISQNYFFAQLVAQALVMATMAGAIWIEARYSRVASAAVVLGAVWFVTGVHLLPALELLVVLAGLLALDVVRLRTPLRERIPRALLACAVSGIGAMLLVMQPAFSAMRSIANNNGDISLGPLAPLWSIVIVCFIAIGCSNSLLRAWWRDPVACVMHKYLGLYGAAVSGLCLLQAVLRWFNIGSDYAAKKYAFAVVTFLFMRLALWLGNKLASWMSAKPRLAKAREHPAAAVAIFALTLSATVASATKIRTDIDARAVVSLEQELLQLPASAFPLPVAGRPNVILDLPGMPNVVNYMFSLTVAHTPRDAALAVLNMGKSGSAPVPLAQFGTIMTATDSTRFVDAGRCAKMQGISLMAIDAMCLDSLAVAILARNPAPAQ